ncbi:MAG: ribonuclease P protein component [Candidatus Sericytochromatia bacterium]
MLSKEKRLRKNSDFEKVYHCGKSLSCKILVLYVLKKENPESIRFGFSISKKISKKAVIRNKIKRQLASIIRKESLNISDKSLDLVFIARKAILDANFDKINESVNYLLNKSGINNSAKA